MEEVVDADARDVFLRVDAGVPRAAIKPAAGEPARRKCCGARYSRTSRSRDRGTRPWRSSSGANAHSKPPPMVQPICFSRKAPKYWGMPQWVARSNDEADLGGGVQRAKRQAARRIDQHPIPPRGAEAHAGRREPIESFRCLTRCEGRNVKPAAGSITGLHTRRSCLPSGRSSWRPIRRQATGPAPLILTAELAAHGSGRPIVAIGVREQVISGSRDVSRQRACLSLQSTVDWNNTKRRVYTLRPAVYSSFSADSATIDAEIATCPGKQRARPGEPAPPDRRQRPSRQARARQHLQVRSSSWKPPMVRVK